MLALALAGLAGLVVGAGACANLGAVDDAPLEASGGAGVAGARMTNGAGAGNVSGATSSAGGARAAAPRPRAEVLRTRAAAMQARRARVHRVQAAEAAAGAGSGAGAGGSSMMGGAGAGAAGAPLAGTQAVKGLGFNLSGSSCDDLKTLGLSWFYAWSATNPCPTATMEFVPQVWGSWKKLSWVPTPAKAVAKGAKALLGFNEPDGAAQANLTVDEAVALWPDTDQPGVLIGSPAVAGMDTLATELHDANRCQEPARRFHRRALVRLGFWQLQRHLSARRQDQVGRAVEEAHLDHRVELPLAVRRRGQEIPERRARDAEETPARRALRLVPIPLDR